MTGSDPHRDMPLIRAGVDPVQASLGLVLVHGRGGSARDILGLAGALERQDITVTAPEAAGNSWWPVSFLAPQAQLDPWLDSALASVGRAVAAIEAGGMPRDRIAVCGFSQGACLALEYAARAGGPFAAVIGLSGALVGTADAPGEPDPALFGYGPKMFLYSGRLDDVPVYLGCHAGDPHIPRARVERTAVVMGDLGAKVETCIHPGQGHGITSDDLAAFRRLLEG